MYEVGRLAVKTAGRDAGRKCVIVNILDEKFVMIDGETRRRKCNIAHLEPLNNVIKISKGASHEDVKKEFKKIGLDVKETKKKEKAEKPKKVRKEKVAEEAESEEKKPKEKKPKKAEERKK